MRKVYDSRLFNEWHAFFLGIQGTSGRLMNRHVSLLRVCCLSIAMLAPSSTAQASGVGDMGAALHDTYFYGFVPAGILLPEYSLRIDEELRHGLQWEVPLLIVSDDLEGPVWGGGPSVSWYPSDDDLMLRATVRAMWPIRSSEESWKTEVTGISVGLGGFWYGEGYGPRAELRLRHWCWAGVFVSLAWEPVVRPSFSQGGEVSAGLEFPIPL